MRTDFAVKKITLTFAVSKALSSGGGGGGNCCYFLFCIIFSATESSLQRQNCLVVVGFCCCFLFFQQQQFTATQLSRVFPVTIVRSDIPVTYFSSHNSVPL